MCALLLRLGLFANYPSFLHLVQHRFASHCCETLFIHAAPVVTAELVAPIPAGPTIDQGEPEVSMEDLFLHTQDELDENLGYLMTDQFASHALRVLLVVLSGKSITDANTKAIIKSKKSEDIGSTISHEKRSADSGPRSVPRTFHAAVDSMISTLVNGLETNSLRALATHPIGNPVLQLLLEIAVSKSGKTKARDPTSLFKKLLPDDPPEEGTDSAAFINGLLYDPVGSRLLETIIQFAPGHAFKALYKYLFRERLGTLARNDVACFPVIKILERLSKERLEPAIEQLCPKIRTLIERSRTSVIKAMIEQSRIRGVDTHPITEALQEAYGKEPADALSKMLGLHTYSHDDIAEERRKQIEAQDVSKVHGSLLAQSMLEMPGPMRQMVLDGLIAMDTLTLERLAKDRSATHVLQASLKCPDQSPTASYRRTIVQRLTPRCVDLALDSIASHVVDAMYDASKDLRHPHERVAQELVKGESLLRQIPSGRAVWRNWKIDLYKRRRTAWLDDEEDEEPAKTIDFTQRGVKLEVAKAKRGQKPKTAIELARERHAAGLPPPHKSKAKREQRPKTAIELARERHGADVPSNYKSKDVRQIRLGRGGREAALAA